MNYWNQLLGISRRRLFCFMSNFCYSFKKSLSHFFSQKYSFLKNILISIFFETKKLFSLIKSFAKYSFQDKKSWQSFRRKLSFLRPTPPTKFFPLKSANKSCYKLKCCMLIFTSLLPNKPLLSLFFLRYVALHYLNEV